VTCIVYHIFRANLENELPDRQKRDLNVPGRFRRSPDHDVVFVSSETFADTTLNHIRRVVSTRRDHACDFRTVRPLESLSLHVTDVIKGSVSARLSDENKSRNRLVITEIGGRPGTLKASRF